MGRSNTEILIRQLIDEASKVEKNHFYNKIPADFKKAELYLKEPYEFLNVNPDELNKTVSPLNYTQRFMKELRVILGKPEDFKKLTTYEQNKIQRVLELINVQEYEWKHITSSTPHPFVAFKMFPEGFSNYQEIVGSYIFPSQDALFRTQRNYMNFFKYKVKNLVTGISKTLSDQHPLFNLMVDLDDRDFDIILRDHISSKWIFDDILRVITKTANDSLFTSKYQDKTDSNIERVIEEDDALVIDRVSITYRCDKMLAMYYMNASLCYLIHKQEKLGEKDTAFELKSLGYRVRTFLTHQTRLYQDKSFWGSHNDNTMTILNIIEQSGVFEKTLVEKNKRHGQKKSYIRYILPRKLNPQIFKVTSLPRLTAPAKITESNIMDNIKPVLHGDGSITKSKSLIKTLNTAHLKRFGVNESYLFILTSLFEKSNLTNNYNLLAEKLGKALPCPNLKTIALLKKIYRGMLQFFREHFELTLFVEYNKRAEW